MFRRRKGEFDDLEARLQAGRPEPPEELLRSISRAVEPPRRSRPVLRIGLAAALTLVLVVTLVALGAFSRSSAAATGVVRFVQSGSFSTSSHASGSSTAPSGGSTLASGSVSSADDQYHEMITICHRTSATDPGNTLKLSPSGAANHLQHHQFDYAGPCHS